MEIPKCLQANEWINLLYCILTKEHYLTIKSNLGASDGLVGKTTEGLSLNPQQSHKKARQG